MESRAAVDGSHCQQQKIDIKINHQGKYKYIYIYIYIRPAKIYDGDTPERLSTDDGELCSTHTHSTYTGNRWPATSATKKIRGNTQHMHSKLNDMHDVAK